MRARAVSVFQSIFVLMLALSLYGCTDGAHRTANFAPGSVAPDFTLMTLEGREFKLSDHRGKVILLNFWASWCSPCVAELPALQRLQDMLKDRGFMVVGVGVDDEAGNLASFAQRFGITYPVVFDRLSETKKRYGIAGYPESFVIDAEGKFAMMLDPLRGGASVRMIGPREWDEPSMTNQFKALLK